MDKDIIREGKCIECHAHIVIYSDGSRSACDCKPERADTEQDKAFAKWIEDQRKGGKQ